MTRATQDSHPSKNQRMPSFATAKLAEKYQKKLASKDSTSCPAGQVMNMFNNQTGSPLAKQAGCFIY